MRLYVASSWRNRYQPDLVKELREAGHQVYDFRHPAPGNDGFAWRQIDPRWEDWTPEQYRSALRHPIARAGFACDLGGMTGAEGCVLVLPCGRSAHLEAGWFMGKGLPVFVYIPEPVEPELMYLLAKDGASALCTDLVQLRQVLRLPPTERSFYIQALGNVVGNCALWWRPGRSGYTCDLLQAGLYGEAEARAIERVRGEDRAWPREVVDVLAARHVHFDRLRELREASKA